MAKSEIKMKMSLDSSGVKASLARAGQSIKNFAQGANERLGSVAKMVGVGMVAAFAGFAKKALDMGTTLSDIATSTGFATEEFQVFRGALIDAGGKAESMEKGINNMQKAIVQGAEGMTTFTRAFDRLGLSVDDLRQMTPEQQFQTIAKAIAEADDQQGAYTSSMEIFGTKVAPRMREVFDRLAKDGYQKMAEDVKESYGIMDEKTQASLDKSADAIERFKNKATIKIGELISGEANFAALKALGARVGQLLATAGEAIINTLMGGVKDVGSYLAAAFKTAGENLMKSINIIGLEAQKALAPLFNKMADMLGNIGIEIGKWDVTEIQGKINSINFDNPLDRVVELKNEYRSAWDEVLPPVKSASKAFGELAETYEMQAKTAGVVEEQLKRNKDAAEKAAAAQAAGHEEITESMRLQNDLAEAMRRGDDYMIEKITEQLKIEKEIEKIKKQHGLTDEEARDHVERMIAKERELADAKEREGGKEQARLDARKQKELDVLRARADGHDHIADALQNQIDKEQEALDIAKEFGISLDEARVIAEKLAAIEFGPDLNQSGFVTPKEQREWEIGQKAKAREQRAREMREIRDEREVGGALRKKIIPKDLTIKERMARDAERAVRRRENQEIGRRLRRGEDEAAVLAEIEARRQQRADLAKIQNAQDRKAEEARRKQENEELERLKKGGDQKKLEDRQKEIEEARRQRLKDAGVDVPPPPKEPAKPKNEVVKELGPKLDDIITQLQGVNKKLEC